MKRLFCLILLLLILPASAQAEGLKVLVSIPPEAWFVNQVAGNEATVVIMVPPGASPHSYEPKPGQMAAVAQADLYLAIGVEFEETWLPRFTGTNPKLVVQHLDEGIVKLPMEEHHHEGEDEHHESEHHEPPAGAPGPMHSGSKPLGPPPGHDMAGHKPPVPGGHEPMHAESGHGPEDPGHEEHHHHDGLDPHVWLSPDLALTIVDNVQRALTQARPDLAPVFAANAERARDRIRSLGAEIAAGFQGLASRRFVVFHPSWGYFARQFGLEQMPIEVGGREPSPRELHDLLAEALEHKVRAVFVQPQMSKRTAEVVARELSGRVVEADPLALDWDANLTRVAAELAAAMREAR